MAERGKRMTEGQDKLGFGIVGCGLVSAFHARAICSIEEARLVGFADIAKDRALQRANEFGGDVYSDFRALIERDDVHVVAICTPNGLHEEVAVAAAGAGKHIIVEKPPELTLERTDRMIAACRRAGVKCSAVLQTRFRPSIAALKRAVDAGTLGRILLGDVTMKWFRSDAYYRRDAWRGTKSLEGGMLMHLAFHYIDLLCWLMGSVKSVQAKTARLLHHSIETEDTGIAVLQFANGALGVVEASTAVNPGIDVRIEIHGERGSVRVEGERVRQWHIDGQENEEIKATFSRDVPTASRGEAAFEWEEHRLQILDMINAIRTNREPSVTCEDGRTTLEVILALYNSAETGIEVSLPLGAAGMK
jgi:predicted dehydrogenase